MKLMKRLTHYYRILTILLLSSCSHYSTADDEILSDQLDSLLTCTDYSDINNTCYITADNGCTFDDQSNKLGNAFIVLFPKEENYSLIKLDSLYSIDYSLYEGKIDQLNNLDTKGIKENFIITVVLTPKDDLVLTPEGYTEKQNINVTTYHHDNKWSLVSIRNFSSNDLYYSYIDSLTGK